MKDRRTKEELLKEITKLETRVRWQDTVLKARGNILAKTEAKLENLSRTAKEMKRCLDIIDGTTKAMFGR